jgi:hypothetical protein
LAKRPGRSRLFLKWISVFFRNFPLPKAEKYDKVNTHDRGRGRDEAALAGRRRPQRGQIRRIHPPGAEAGWGRGEHLRHCLRSPSASQLRYLPALARSACQSRWERPPAFSVFLRACLISRCVWIGEWIFCPARQKSAGILTDGKERLCNDRIERSCTIQFCTAPRWGRCRIYNAVRAENTPPRHARGRF